MTICFLNSLVKLRFALRDESTAIVVTFSYFLVYHNNDLIKLVLLSVADPAADMLNDKVLPFFDSEQVPLLRILTDRGTEYNGHKESHAYELYLNLEDIEHTKTKAYIPQTNGICERFHKTMKTECYDILFRRKIYTQLSEIQNDIEQWLEFYNRERAHSGKYCYGKTPWQTWNDAKGLVKETQLENLFCSSGTHFVKMKADE
ncbi:hypothetical protein A9G35_08150 [Gilliamella sp. Choc5-1]|nr:hypothetical protein A9G35_08150 [Gilliamella apicola]